MKAIGIRAIALGAFVLLLTGCGSAESETVTADSPADDSPATSAASVDLEEITPGGIAALVVKSLGPETVKKFRTPDPQPDTVSVMVQLQDSTQHMFVIEVFSPEQAEVYGAAGPCRDEPDSQRGSQCRVLDNGTTLTLREDADGFSDDNVDGVVISGTAVTPSDGGASAIYESYDDSPAVSATDLEALLSDPDLTWQTNPAVNEAGADIDLTALNDD